MANQDIITLLVQRFLDFSFWHFLIYKFLLNMLVKIFLKLTKTIHLIVRNSDVTRNIKAIVEEREGIPASHLTVTLAGNQLDEDRTLDSYGMHDGSVLDMYQSHVYISVKSSSSRQTVRIHAKITDLI